MKATLSNYRQAPRKVRLLANLVRGKTVAAALAELSFTDKRSAEPIMKLISSAAANAEKNFGQSQELLFIKDIRVDKGLIMKRFLPRARGRATPLRHRMSHVNIELGVRIDKEVARPAKTKTKTVQ